MSLWSKVHDKITMISLYVRAPEDAPIKQKMNYASSKESIKKVLTGKCFFSFLILSNLNCGGNTRCYTSFVP